ncbi:hypothetical protein RchiOBHm_Chr1g0342261 [Rosa chinensis]|uniref:Uncharacterized protein n=1 Tax=Rosa chinensis TaxID=74649 RepID=A0A2P6SDY2_ROSCH|nr:hypothetical protein RchiOBHm_Chr1g0342261 [Rosa chinensis]
MMMKSFDAWNLWVSNSQIPKRKLREWKNGRERMGEESSSKGCPVFLWCAAPVHL